jgi:ribonuclease P protein component
MKRNLTKQEIIRKRHDIKTVFGQCKSSQVRGLRLLWLHNNLGFSRILMSPAKRYGNAVQRNYIRRIGKEVYRAIKEHIKQSYDLAFIFFPGSYSFQDRQLQMIEVLSASQLLKLKPPIDTHYCP